MNHFTRPSSIQNTPPRSSPRPSPWPWTVLATFMLTSGCISAEVDIPGLELTQQDLGFPGAPAEQVEAAPEDADTGDLLAQAREPYHFPPVSFSYATVPLNLPPGTEPDMRAEQVTVSVHDGIDDLSFVTRMRLTVTRLGEEPEDPMVLLEYPGSRPADDPIGSCVTMPVLASQQSLDPWQAPSLVYELDIWGDPAQSPRTDWSVDVSILLRGSVSYH